MEFKVTSRKAWKIYFWVSGLIILVMLSPRLAQRVPISAPAPAISEEIGTIRFLPGETQKEVELKPGVWTKWIGLPPLVQGRIDTATNKNEIRIRFLCGYETTLRKEPVYLRPRREIFRLLSPVQEKATITLM